MKEKRTQSFTVSNEIFEKCEEQAKLAKQETDAWALHALFDVALHEARLNLSLDAKAMKLFTTIAKSHGKTVEQWARESIELRIREINRLRGGI